MQTKSGRKYDYKIGAVFNGNKIVDIVPRAHGRQQRIVAYVVFHCRTCGARSEVYMGGASNWLQQGKPWTCAGCRATADRKNQLDRRKLVTELKTVAVLSTREVLDRGGRRMVFLTVNCPVCTTQFEGGAHGLRMMENADGIRCGNCKKKHANKMKPLNGSQIRYGQKVNNTIIRALGKMPQSQQQAVEEIVRGYVGACCRLGCGVENLDQVYVEAMADVVRGDVPPKLPTRHVSSEPFRRYEQYQSPIAD